MVNYGVYQKLTITYYVYKIKKIRTCFFTTVVATDRNKPNIKEVYNTLSILPTPYFIPKHYIKSYFLLSIIFLFLPLIPHFDLPFSCLSCLLFFLHFLFLKNCPPRCCIHSLPCQSRQREYGTLFNPVI